MKKSLVLAMAMALGVTASAYAANPFSDVPAGHWAYDSVAELAANGVIDGYTDGSFGGDKLMTRYEMAQITARAMANGADVDALAAEFAEELDTMGVRVANLEKKADNVKIRGEVRARYIDQSGAAFNDSINKHTNLLVGNESNHEADLRTRLWVEGTINNNWKYTGMLQNVQDLTDNGGNDDVKLKRAYLEGRLGGTDVVAGRYNMLVADGNVFDGTVDGVAASYGEKVKVTAFAGKASDGFTVLPVAFSQIGGDGYINGDLDTAGDYIGVAVDTKFGEKLGFTVGYVDFSKIGEDYTIFAGPTITNTGASNGIFNVGLTYDVDENLRLGATYLKGDLSVDLYDVEFDGKKITDGASAEDVAEVQGNIDAVTDRLLEDDGFVLSVDYKGVNKADKGSWGAWAKYYDQGAHTYLAHTTDANTFGMSGFEGYGVGVDYAVAKNIVASVAYYDTESKLVKKLGDKLDDQRLWTSVQFYF